MADATATLIPLGEASRCLRVPADWLKSEADAGRVPHLRAGSRLLFDVDAVGAVLLERARQVPEVAARA